MEFEFVEQSAVFTFQNDNKYDKGFKSRTLKKVKQDVTPAGLKKVGDALATLLDGDVLSEIETIERKSFNLAELN